MLDSKFNFKLCSEINSRNLTLKTSITKRFYTKPTFVWDKISCVTAFQG